MCLCVCVCVCVCVYVCVCVRAYPAACLSISTRINTFRIPGHTIYVFTWCMHACTRAHCYTKDTLYTKKCTTHKENTSHLI